jgi:hypothetical protein
MCDHTPAGLQTTDGAYLFLLALRTNYRDTFHHSSTRLGICSLIICINRFMTSHLERHAEPDALQVSPTTNSLITKHFAYEIARFGWSDPLAPDQDEWTPAKSAHVLTGATGTLFSGAKIRNFPKGQLKFADGWVASADSEAKGNAAVDGNVGGNAGEVHGANGVACEQWAVVTTINEVTEGVRRVAGLHKCCLVVVGDKKGPFNYTLPPSKTGSAVFFLDAAEQERMSPTNKLIQHTPWSHFGRKNIGALLVCLCAKTRTHVDARVNIVCARTSSLFAYRFTHSLPIVLLDLVTFPNKCCVVLQSMQC